MVVIAGAMLTFLAVIYLVPREGVATPRDQQIARDRCAERRGQLPPKTFTSDGCSLWPDAGIRSCCVRHDMQYWCGGAEKARATADRAFMRCVNDKSIAPSWLIYASVRIGGWQWWPVPWRWGYGWTWPSAGPSAAM